MGKWGVRCVQKGRGRSSPSINLQAEAELNSRTHGRSQGQRCEPVLAVHGEWGLRSLFLPAQASTPGHLLFRLQPSVGF